MSETLAALRRALRKSGKTRYQLAKQGKLDQGQLSRFWHGTGGLGLDQAERLADALGLNLALIPKKGTKRGKPDNK
jgi:transcriptional regulator with XRE-family HTH domain